jgi:hypothetical protein
MNSETAKRLELRKAGYLPIPVEGKIPPLQEWEKRTNTNDKEIELWEKVFPRAKNNGLLTRPMPTFDIDITNPEAAVAIEELVRERFEERGYILIRIGRAPKRAIPFRTNTPFKKITRNLEIPGHEDKQEKLELLADGQQMVAFGIHPDTGKPYTWHGGEPGEKIKLADLPYISEAEAKQLVTDAAELLKQFGYEPKAARPNKETGNGGNTGSDSSDWNWLIENILHGRELHDSLRDLAFKLIVSGMSEDAAGNMLRGLMEKITTPHDERWLERYTDIPRLVSSARGKIDGQQSGKQQAQPNAAKKLVQSSAEFTASFVPPDPLITGILQRRFIYALTGHTGRGKTAIALLFAALVALGQRLGELDVEKGRVLILAGENPTDAKMRWIAMSQQLDFDRNEIDVHWIEGTLKLSRGFQQIRREVEELGGVDFIIVDSSAAFFEGDDENNNAQQGIHARRLRQLTTLHGGPCVLVLCHPPKNAGDDNLQPRGGGAYVAELDGNLTAVKDDITVELHWQAKLRGPDFAPVNFMLKSVTHEELKDTRGRLISTVVAAHLSDTAQEDMTKAARCDEDLALQALKKNPRASVADLARDLGWYTTSGKPYRSKAHRVLGQLQRDKLVKKERGRFELTEKGEKALQGRP